MASDSFLQRWEPVFLSILRIMIGLLLLQHGMQKLFHFPPPDVPAAGGGGLSPLMLVAGWLEFGCGLLLVFGLFTRPVAFIVCGMMATAYFMAHAPQGVFPIKNRGELAVAYCFVFLYLAVPAAAVGAWMRSGVGKIGPQPPL